MSILKVWKQDNIFFRKSTIENLFNILYSNFIYICVYSNF